MPATSRRSSSTWRAATRLLEPSCHEPRPAARLRGDDSRARDLPRLRGDLEGADAPAHAADVRHERDPRNRDRRRDARHGREWQGHAHLGDRLRRGRPRLCQRGRRLRRDRSNARDVQAQATSGAPRDRRPVSRTTTDLLYLVTIVTFIVALRFLSQPDKARWGNRIGAAGMLLAIAVTFAQNEIVSYWEIAVGMVLGGGFGAVAARRVKMTAMPQMVALFNGVGGGAAALISLAELHKILPNPGRPKLDISTAIALSGLIGAISFAGSMIAFAKLQELIQGRPITYPGQKFGNLALLAACVGVGVTLVAGVQDEWLLWVVIGGAALFGVLFVLPIGGADMPVVISLLNAFTGLAVAVGGFELENNVLIVSGMLVGASGT